MLALQILFIGAACLAAGSTIWFTLWLGIGPVPSSSKARQAMLAAVGAAPAGTVVDLGSGWGTLAIACARRHRQRQVIGYEMSWLPWAVSVALQRCLGLRNLCFVRRNFLDAELAGHAVLLCYLCRPGMRQLARKLERDAAWPALLVSNTFALPCALPKHVLHVDDLYSTPVFVYGGRPGRASRLSRAV